MATIYIGHASISEKGTAEGTKGDQTGKEVCVRTWYNYSGGWDFIAIHPDADVREKIAATVEAACANDNIGYGQSNRNGLHTLAVDVGYELSKITTACNCDCSSLVHVASIAAGAMPESSYGSNAMVTASMRSVMSAYGFIIITSSTYAQDSSYCVRGAVLVKEGHHTVTCLTSGGNYKKTLSKAEEIGNNATPQPADAKDSSLAGTYTVTASDGLNLRYGAGTTWAVITILPCGVKVQCYGYYSETSGTRWLYVAYYADGTTYTGFASSKYLEAEDGTTVTGDGKEIEEDGEIGPDTVRHIQRLCALEDVDGFIDGQDPDERDHWDSITEDACKWTGGYSDTAHAMQKLVRDHGFYIGDKATFADGELGLYSALAWQLFLSTRGYYSGTIDGDFGPESALAMQKWINSYNWD